MTKSELADKYRRMAALRRELPADHPPEADARARLKQLAREFPGALRELDSLPTDEIDRRLAALESGVEEPWMRWMCRFHTLMRAALQIRLTGKADVDESFVKAVAAPRHGRLMVVVFERIAAEEGLERGAVWDALFPPRKGPRDYRRS